MLLNDPMLRFARPGTDAAKYVLAAVVGVAHAFDMQQVEAVFANVLPDCLTFFLKHLFAMNVINLHMKPIV
ncbi:hypothetical protein [Comamonas guangdongensis]|uniref:Uncharacterized protein n=1 Tax=Comamonas guangdongensis TaxID=510515 RepID=A0ABV3ZYZ5_9BURK